MESVVRYKFVIKFTSLRFKLLPLMHQHLVIKSINIINIVFCWYYYKNWPFLLEVIHKNALECKNLFKFGARICKVCMTFIVQIIGIINLYWYLYVMIWMLTKTTINTFLLPVRETNNNKNCISYFRNRNRNNYLSFLPDPKFHALSVTFKTYKDDFEINFMQL